MHTINMGEDITPFYKDPMEQHVTVFYTQGDSYNTDDSCGDMLTKFHIKLQELDFPYFFVKIVTTNKNIKKELLQLTKLYSSESKHLEYKIVPGSFTKKVYNGDTKCILPKIHKYVNPQGLVMPCCVADEKYPYGNINNNKLEDISTQSVIDQMEKGQRPDACSLCWEKEDLGLPSNRIGANKTFKKYLKQKDFTLKMLDIRLSNKCNLMCRMCSGKFSNRIAQEETKLYGYTKYKDEILSPDLVEQQLEYIEKNKNTIDHVYFAGGEPLINEEHYRILDIFIAAGLTDIQLQYNTNFSILNFKSYNVLDYWKHFKKVELGASIDAIGNISSYVRHGVKYNVLEENYKKIKNMENVHFTIRSTLHFQNLFNLMDLQKRWLDLGLKCTDIYSNLLINPPEQSLRVLPANYKTNATKKILEHIKYLKTFYNPQNMIQDWEQALDFMNTKDESNLLGKFFTISDAKDKNRKQVFEDYFPEYKQLRTFAK